MIVIMPVIAWIMVFNNPLLSVCLIWLTCVNVLTFTGIISSNINCETCEFVLKSEGTDTISPSLIWNTNVFVANDVSVETFKDY